MVGAIAFALAALLNAHTLYDMANRQPFDSSTRGVALAVTKPLKSVADALGFSGPRQAIDDVRGRKEQGNTKFAFTTTTTTHATTPVGGGQASGTAGNAGTTPADSVAPRHVPTGSDPLRLYIAGDSQAEAFGESLERIAGETGVIAPTLDFKVSSGLTRPDFFDWPARLQDQVRQIQPDVVVIDFGGNDAQPIRLESGDTVDVSDPRWSAEYTKRASEAMDFLSADGRKVIWVGTPNAREPGFTKRLGTLRDAVKAALAKHPSVNFVDSWTMFQSPDGGYADYTVDDDGQAKLMRANDGFHLNLTGASKLARTIEATIEAEVKARGGKVG
jgi:hypothetical protein